MSLVSSIRSLSESVANLDYSEQSCKLGGLEGYCAAKQALGWH